MKKQAKIVFGAILVASPLKGCTTREQNADSWVSSEGGAIDPSGLFKSDSIKPANCNLIGWYANLADLGGKRSIPANTLAQRSIPIANFLAANKTQSVLLTGKGYLLSAAEAGAIQLRVSLVCETELECKAVVNLSVPSRGGGLNLKKELKYHEKDRSKWHENILPQVFADLPKCIKT